MRCAVLGDIHANLHALEAVLEDARSYGCTEFRFLGDAVGYGAFPSECVEILRKLPGLSVMGNHDQAAATDLSLEKFSDTARATLEWTRPRLSADQKAWLAALPPRRQLRGTIIVHAGLDSPLSWGYIRSLDTAEMSFAYQGAPLCFIGHTHVPQAFQHGVGEFPLTEGEGFAPQPGAKYLINAGSVGQSRDGDPRAAYIIHDEEEHGIWLRRVAYDNDAAATAVMEAGFPEKLATRLRTGS